MINNNTNLNKNKIKKYNHLKYDGSVNVKENEDIIKYEDKVIIEHVLKENKVNVLNKLFGKKKKLSLIVLSI